jgi:hypothetical protein
MPAPFYSLGSSNFWLDLPTASGGGGSDEDMIFISKQTASAVSSVEFTSGIDSTYDNYTFIFKGIVSSANDWWGVDYSTNGGTSYATTKSNFTYNPAMYISSGAGWITAPPITYNVFSLGSQTSVMPLGLDPVSGTPQVSSGSLSIFNINDTSNYKMGQHRIVNGAVGATGTYIAGWNGASQIETTSAINAVKFSTNSGTFSGDFVLYGLKES